MRVPGFPRFGQCGPEPGDDDETERDSTEAYLASVDMSGAELFVFNVFFTLLASIIFVISHRTAERLLVKFMKGKPAQKAAAACEEVEAVCVKLVEQAEFVVEVLQ